MKNILSETENGNAQKNSLSLCGKHHNMMFRLVSDIHDVVGVNTDATGPTKLLMLFSFTANSSKMPSLWCEFEHLTFVEIGNINHAIAVYCHTLWG